MKGSVLEPADLLELVRALHNERQQMMLSQWNRSVPLADELTDRWERAAALGFGTGSSIYDSSLVIGNVKVGERTWIGPFTVLDGSGGLEIGSTCSISAGVQIYSHNSVKWALSGGQAQYDYAPVVIGSSTYIGPMTIIAKGVTIGECCVVGANSVVDKDLPPNSIAYGSTCRIVGRVVVNASGEIDLVYADDANSGRGVSQ